MDNQNYESESIKKESNNKIFIIVICLFIFVIMVIGISMAAFTYTRESNNNVNTISTGNIYLNYAENSNGINITDAYPINDEAGRVLTDENYYFDFTVEASITGDVVADYEISAEKLENSTLGNDEVKLYLEKMVDNEYEEVMAPKHFTPLTESTDLGTMAGAMLLDSGSFDKSSNVKYRLRMWVDENTVVGDLQKTFGVTVSVKAKVDLDD
mgnify:CR=1 FL=1